MKTYKEYLDYCNSIAEDINDDYPDDLYDINQVIHDKADGSCHVIYYSKAWDLVNMMRDYHHEKFTNAVDEVQSSGFEFEGDINTHITWIAYYLIRNGIHSAYNKLETKEVA